MAQQMERGEWRAGKGSEERKGGKCTEGANEGSGRERGKRGKKGGSVRLRYIAPLSAALERRVAHILGTLVRLSFPRQRAG